MGGGGGGLLETLYFLTYSTNYRGAGDCAGGAGVRVGVEGMHAWN